jgi:hypothetical protein
VGNAGRHLPRLDKPAVPQPAEKAHVTDPLPSRRETLADNPAHFGTMAGRNPHHDLGGFLWVVSPEDSKKVAEFPLDAPPVYQGVAVAGGRVYVSLQNGQMVCFGKAD